MLQCQYIICEPILELEASRCEKLTVKFGDDAGKTHIMLLNMLMRFAPRVLMTAWRSTQTRPVLKHSGCPGVVGYYYVIWR